MEERTVLSSLIFKDKKEKRMSLDDFADATKLSILYKEVRTIIFFYLISFLPSFG